MISSITTLSNNTYLAENTSESSFYLKWYHHMNCYKKFCDEEKIRRQERSEEKRAKPSTETVPVFIYCKRIHGTNRRGGRAK